MTNTKNSSEKRAKRWHQKWWGIIFLLALAIFFIYVGLYIYQTVILVEMQRQSYNQIFVSGSSTNSSLNPNSPVLNQETVRKELIERMNEGEVFAVDLRIEQFFNRHSDFRVRIIAPLPAIACSVVPGAIWDIMNSAILHIYNRAVEPKTCTRNKKYRTLNQGIRAFIPWHAGCILYNHCL